MKFKYPKLLGVIVAILLAYILFSFPFMKNFISGLGSLGYFGSFIAGMFYTFGFTSPFSAGFFIDLNPQSIWLAGILGGVGAFIGDMFIFELIRVSFKGEFEKLGKEKPIKWIGRFFEKFFGRRIRTFLLCVVAVIFIGSPLPDEAGLTLLAGFTKIHDYVIAIISIIANTAGILVLLML